MSERDVELQRGFIGAFNARDIEAMIAYCDPSIEFHSAFAAVAPMVYRGHEGLRSWHRDLEETWGEEIRNEPERYFDLGEQALGYYVMHGRGRQSGAEVAMPTAVVARSRDGLVIYWHVSARRNEALADLGVSEDELEPLDP